nr:MAG TPA: Receptor tyrosine-protein kinase erbB-3 [Caudoviricetes sp.]
MISTFFEIFLIFLLTFLYSREYNIIIEKR